MRATRKVCTNTEERQNVLLYNRQLEAEFAGQPIRPNLLVVPKPIYDLVPFNFKVHHINNAYVEPKDPKDIIVNLLYEGIVRIAYEPLIESQLEMYFSLGI